MAVWEVAKSVGGATIGHTELSSLSGAVTFGTGTGDDRISQAYDHLWLVASARTNVNADWYSAINVRVGNGSLDTGTNYSTCWLGTGGNGTWGWSDTGIAYWTAGYITGNRNDPTPGLKIFGNYNLWLPYYSNTSHFKQSLGHAQGENTSSTDSQWSVSDVAGLWQSTAAIDTISVYPSASGYSFKTYSSFTLYGITGSS